MEDKKTIRLNKYLAMCGVCSRREADRLIEQGRVFVNGVAAIAGIGVADGDEVCLDGKVLGLSEKKVVLAFYKPVGVVCSEKDSHAEKLVTDCISYPIRVTYAGRLDKESEGLLLLSNDGDLIQAMMKGRNAHEKEYIVTVHKKITDTFLKSMGRGVYLEELDVKTRPCVVEGISEKTFRIILTQGLNRQIRRMCTAFGYEVVALKRVRIMSVNLDGLKQGEYRELKPEELARLYEQCGLKEEFV